MYTMVAERWMPELQYEQEKEGKHKRQFADRRNNMRRPITGDKQKLMLATTAIVQQIPKYNPVDRLFYPAPFGALCLLPRFRHYIDESYSYKSTKYCVLGLESRTLGSTITPRKIHGIH